MSVPNSRNWKAVERSNIRISGEVQAQSPSLDKRVPQSLDPRILMLDMSKVDDGSDYEKIEYQEPSDGHAYDQVEIFYLGQEVSRIAVEHPKATAKKGRAKGVKKAAGPARTKSVKKKTARKKTKKTAKKTRRTAKKKAKTRRAKASRKKRN